jgi:hypothetical protein
MKCAAHPNVETNLACSRCGTPICPKCLVQTPVGARCPKCAGMRRLPTYEVKPQHYVRAVGFGLLVAVAVGVAWAWLREVIPLFAFSLLLSILLAAGVGYAIGEVVSRSVNRKRGVPLQVIGGACFLVSYLVSHVGLSPDATLLFFAHFSLYDLLVLALGMIVTIGRLR